MPEFHAEPYIHLAGLSPKSALIAWGAFYFQTRTKHEWKLVDTDRMEPLLPLFTRGGVRAVFSGHEHNFQHASHGGIDYFVTGAGSKVRKGAPDDLAGAHTLSWADEAHFPLVTIAGNTMTVRTIGELAADEVRDLDRVSAGGQRVAGPILVTI